ncbi:type IV secretory system conjugative DNA transfer family protein [Streptomyces sp. NBC_00582]|uniref:type IV secretory system conjugative DNA transfer family protein n=1 Tax=Streptomyces sp. NBC_00582 TaxID=2975783 RepID=UPI002E804FA4|nr:type VI secretion protein [Streptomyces sp. NBC_00582]WUB63491.1 type VI secretion protein [Streptomyces sp. NBC_00582]
MRPGEERAPGREGGQAGGIPDGLLVGLLAFLLGMTLLVWTATGLAALFTHGSWPAGVTFTRTPLAMRHLVAQPHDIAGAWPAAPATSLSGYGLFWGLFIGQLMILFVLTVFAIGTVARWRTVRARRRATPKPNPQPHEAPIPGTGTLPPTAPPHPAPPHPHLPQTEPPGTHSSHTDSPHTHSPGTEPPRGEPRHTGLPGTEPPRGEPRHTGLPGTEQPYGEPRHTGLPSTEQPYGEPPRTDVPRPDLPRPEPLPSSPGPQTPWTSASLLPGERVGGWESTRAEGAVLYAPPDTRKATATQALRDAEGAALVLTSNPTLWQDTKDARAKLGPVHLYDPTHLCDTPARLHWSPTTGCEDKGTAAHRATALLSPVRPTARLDQALADTAETLLRSYLHAAAIDGRTIRHVHRWSQGTGIQEAVRTLRTNPKAAPGSAGELEAALTAHPERRDIAQELTSRALSALSTINIREACTPNRTDALALDSFVNEGGTLYVVGESLEDPRTNPGAMPLLTALVSSVVERGRRMAVRSSSGRLDPPLTLILDDIAAVAPLPQLPDLLSTGADRGLPTLALLRSREQARARWPHHELPV